MLLSTNPADPDAAKFKKLALILKGNEDVRSVIEWQREAVKILHGLGLNAGMAQHRMIESLLANTALTLYKTQVVVLARECRTERAHAAAEAEDTAGRDQAAQDAAFAAIMGQDLETDDNTNRDVVCEAIKFMVTNILPKRVLARVKRFLRRECRKPMDMKVRIYHQHLLCINNSKIDLLPPFAANQELSQDELLDIILFGTPKSWQREMERQGFDPMDNSVESVVDFMERIETSEDFEPNNQKLKDGKSNKKGKGSNTKTVTSGGTKKCLYHGQCSHRTDECTVLQKLANQKKVKQEDSNSGGKGNYSNKTWKRKADTENDKSKKELAAFVEKQVKAGVKKAFAAKNKRKAEEGELDLNALEEELEDFNYNDMDNLRIDDDGSDISV